MSTMIFPWRGLLTKITVYASPKVNIPPLQNLTVKKALIYTPDLLSITFTLEIDMHDSRGSARTTTNAPNESNM